VLHVLNLGINGESTSQLISADFATQKNNISPGLRNVVVLWEATNDIWFNYVTTGAAALATMQALAALWRAAGCKVIVMDVIARGNFSDAQRAASVSYNALLSAGWASFADGFVELSGAFADYSDLSLYTSDTIHLNTTGYALVASLAQPTVSAVLSTWPAY
jgi:lysophospholipase L1-like esterase